jgi:hypothetical protein
MSNEELIAFLRKNAVAVGCVVASLAIGVTIYLRSDLLPEAEKVFAQNAQKAALLAANIEDSQQLKEQHTALAASNQTISDRMIRVGQLAENLQYFYRLESDTGAKLTDLRQVPQPAPLTKNAPKTAFSPVGFAVTAQGTYPQLMDLLRRLEGGEHYCRVLTCSVHPVAEQRGGAIQMALSLELLGIQ